MLLLYWFKSTKIWLSNQNIQSLWTETDDTVWSMSAGASFQRLLKNFYFNKVSSGAQQVRFVEILNRFSRLPSELNQAFHSHTE